VCVTLGHQIAGRLRKRFNQATATLVCEKTGLIADKFFYLLSLSKTWWSDTTIGTPEKGEPFRLISYNINNILEENPFVMTSLRFCILANFCSGRNGEKKEEQKK
jgi:hypothetical protein